MSYITSIERMGIQEGLKIGYEESSQIACKRIRTEIFLPSLRHKFGEIPNSYQTLIKKADIDTLILWMERFHSMTCLDAIFRKDDVNGQVD